MSAQKPHPFARWISREFAELLAEPGRCSDRPQAVPESFDVLIVGSGYGGAVAAAELAGCHEKKRKISVCVLERGREYLPGAFPSRMADLPGHVRGNVGDRVRGGEALFDMRLGSDVSVVLANGLGGGSLINAGVMRRPHPAILADARWPARLRRKDALVPYYLAVERQLGVRLGKGSQEEINTIARHQAGRRLKKRAILDAMGGAEDARLSIAMQRGQTTSGGVNLEACKLCGDCATGCNYGAKESLDTNLLVKAFDSGAKIYCGATVLRLQRPETRPDLWSVLVTHTEEKLRLREGGPRWIAARKVILAAGSLGSTEILMRSQREPSGPRFSPLLGSRFSGNGDMAVVGYNYTGTAEAGAIANEDDEPDVREVGPTITGMIPAIVDVDGSRKHLLIQEMSVAGPLRRAFEEGVVTANVLHGLGERDRDAHDAGHPTDDPFAVHPAKLARTSAFAVMGDDGAAGALRLGGDEGDWSGDGHVTVDWPGAKHLPLCDAQVAVVNTLATRIKGAGRTMGNPLWRPVPASVEKSTGLPRGPLLTVHPLGGCSMGLDVGSGVVDDRGRVFDAAASATTALHSGLVVLDGSIVPMPLSANPALTIAALALRAVRSLRREWRWPRAPRAERPPDREPGYRPQVAGIAARPPAETQVEITERLAGPITLVSDPNGWQTRTCWAEITLTYAPLRIDRLFRPAAAGALSDAKLVVNEQGKGELRLFSREDWGLARQLQGHARDRFERRHSRTYALTGSLTILEREASHPWGRVARALWAWFRNRGLRDIIGSLFGGGGDVRAILEGPAFASHAREVRTFKYDLAIGPEIAAGGARSPALGSEARHLTGHKRITYARASNPWRQLQEMTVTEFPDMVPGSRAVLRLDPRYLATQGRPLFGIVSQRDHVEALADIASLGAYFLRMLVSIHFWSARKPDRPSQRNVNRLPGSVPLLREPEVHTVEVDRVDGEPVHIRLARYRSHAARGAAGPPVVLIHGYSASGTTYAHPSLKPGLAPFLVRHGARDVWVVDMRSSSGMATATRPWTMERVALMDIPAAIDQVCRRSGSPSVDVVAHCMGAVMLSMAILSAGKHAQADGLWTPADRDATDRFHGERAALRGQIRRVVLSQNGPAMVMTDSNIFRTYAMSYIEDLLRPLTYHFRPEPEQGAAWDLLDRLVATLPYEDDELESENSPWFYLNLRHLGTRHRMDALYGRTFSLGNLSRKVLRDIDDFFGPLSLDTLGQVLHFGRLQTIANRAGRNRFVNLQTLRNLWPSRTLLIHGVDNGMADIATLYRNEALLREAGCDVDCFPVEKFGHQDCLIGNDAPREVFPRLLEFLDAR